MLRKRGGACLLAALVAAALAAAPLRAQEDTELTEGTVSARVDGGGDARVRERLAALFGTLEALRRVEIEVEAGVVRLTGTVPSADARALAGRLAKRVEGVVAVANQLSEDRSVAGRLDQATERLRARAWELLAEVPLLGVALIAFLLFVALGRVASAWDAPLRGLTANPFLQNLARQGVRAGFAVLGVLVALEVLDATAMVGAVLGAAGVAGLAVGFAFRDLIENYIASVLLSVRQPFLPNDHVVIEGHEGRVARLTSRATQLLTLDGNHVRIPNSTVYKGVIENFTRKPERRFEFQVGAGVEEDLVGALDLGAAILRDLCGVLEDPAPYGVVEELGDSSVSLRFYGWVDQREADFQKVRSEAIRCVKQAFDEAEIEMPEPIHRIRVAPDAARAREPERPARSLPEPGARDVSPDRHVEREIERERAGQQDDLLDRGSPVE